MAQITQWQHFKKNYLWTCIFITGLGAVATILDIIRGEGTWYFALFFFFIGLVILPIGNYFSWKKKFGGKS